MPALSPATIKPRRNWKRIAYRILRVPVIAYLLVALLLALLQTKLIFIGASTQGSPNAVVTPLPNSELLHLAAADGTPIAALFAKAPNAAAAPTVLYFYGNAMCLNDALGEVQMFRRLGANCLAVEYAGYGLSGGKPSEQACYASAEAAYQHLLTRSGINTHKIIPAGWSLGAAVAIDLAFRHANENHIAAVMTFSAFTSMVDVASVHYPGIPVSLLLKHRFPSEEKIRGIRVPLLLCHGRHDDIAPFSMSDRLAAAATQGHVPVTRLTLENAAHNDLFLADEDLLENTISAFLQSVSKAP